MKIFNRKAYHEYHIFDKFEAGVVLTGNEVKSIKEGRADITNSFARIKDSEIWLIGANIPLYGQANSKDHDPKRSRKLLLHKNEIITIGIKAKQQGLTLVPISVYTKGRLVKVQVVLAKGKRQYEKREAKRRKDIDLEAQRELRGKKDI